jgi:hypothetical protein
MARPGAVHFYHLWLGGEWRQIAEEHFAKLRQAAFPGRVLVGLVGAPDERAVARAWLRHEVLVEADTGFEDVTINALRASIRSLPGDTAVFYAHSKGAFHDSRENRGWRREMDNYLAIPWADRMRDLQGHDVAAWHWIPVGTPDPFDHPISHPHASGNFWWARADYLRGLPELPALIEDTRIEAELWIGRDSPCVSCLADTWPKITMGWHVGGAIGGMAQPVRWVDNPLTL